MIAATAQESMYLDFMDCPPTMNWRPGSLFPEKAAEEIPTLKAADKDAGRVFYGRAG
jgi:hypothetical protein